MIERYRDHAANERTYLAWVRTGITVMVLGLIVEKFELFLFGLADVLTDKIEHASRSPGPKFVSVALVSLGVAVIVLGAVRFFRVKSELDSSGVMQFRGTILVLVITVALVAFGVYLLLYLARIV
jgi:putative membrane protein